MLQQKDQQQTLLLTVKEAAASLHVGINTVYRLIRKRGEKKPELYSIKIGNAYRIPHKALEMFIESKMYE